MRLIDLRLAEQPIEIRDSDFSFLHPVIPSRLFSVYWQFAAERQRIFFRRQANFPPPWTYDPIIAEFKFTNAYRASDRVSQYLIRNVIYRGDTSPREVFFRTILFKLFNKIETWEMLEKLIGIPTTATYSFEVYDKILTRAAAEQPLYSAAYIMPPGGTGKKHRLHLRLLETMMMDDLPDKIAAAPSMESVFVSLKAYPSIGDFLAYQFAIDLNYGPLTDFSELEFVVAGPGARDGIKKCFETLGGYSEAEVIRLVTEKQDACFAAACVGFPSLWGRKLQLIDCQNLFCEVDKYARVGYPTFLGRKKRQRIKQRLKLSSKPLDPWYPPKWRINDKIDLRLFTVPC